MDIPQEMDNVQHIYGACKQANHDIQKSTLLHMHFNIGVLQVHTDQLCQQHLPQFSLHIIINAIFIVFLKYEYELQMELHVQYIQLPISN
jgi:hypothetical protein